MTADLPYPPRSPPLSVAPMMDRTDRHFRYLFRKVSQRTLLYTEMVTTQAILRGSNPRLLAYDQSEHPLSLQLGGDDPISLVACARIAEDMGYDEVNLNCGCPSDRVQKGRFGAALMGHPTVVAEAVSAMRAAVSIPITVKHRIGIDDLDRYEDMLHFVDTVAEAEPARFTVHARKAWLRGLSPKQNRTVPPLRPEDVYRLKGARPGLQVEMNGGVQSLDEAEAHLTHVDAVMIGRAAYDDPFLFRDADRRFFGEETASPPVERPEVVRAMIPYVERMVGQGERPFSVLRHMLGLFSGQVGGRAYRRVLSVEGPRARTGDGVLEAALSALEEARTRSPRTREGSPPRTAYPGAP